MSRLIGVSAGAAAPYHILNASLRTWISALVARSSTITSGIVANKMIVDLGLVNDGNHRIGAVDEKAGAFRDMMGCTELTAFDRVDTLNQVRVDPKLLLGPVYYVRFDGEIYDLRHGVGGVGGPDVFQGEYFFLFLFFTKSELRPSGKILWNVFENHSVEGSACGAHIRHREGKVANLIAIREPELRLSQATAIDWWQAASPSMALFHWSISMLILNPSSSRWTEARP